MEERSTELHREYLRESHERSCIMMAVDKGMSRIEGWSVRVLLVIRKWGVSRSVTR